MTKGKDYIRLPSCGAVRRDKPCDMVAGERTSHPGWGPCWMHGGRMKNVVLHYKREAVKREVAIYADRVLIDPPKNVLIEQSRTEGAIQYLLRRLNEIPDDKVPQSPYTDLMKWERKHLLSTSGLLITARTVAILEEQEAIQSRLLVDAMEGVLRLYVRPSDLNAAMVTLQRELDKLVERWREVTGAVEVNVPEITREPGAKVVPGTTED